MLILGNGQLHIRQRVLRVLSGQNSARKVQQEQEGRFNRSQDFFALFETSSSSISGGAFLQTYFYDFCNAFGCPRAVVSVVTGNNKFV